MALYLRDFCQCNCSLPGLTLHIPELYHVSQLPLRNYVLYIIKFTYIYILYPDLYPYLLIHQMHSSSTTIARAPTPAPAHALERRSLETAARISLVLLTTFF